MHSHSLPAIDLSIEWTPDIILIIADAYVGLEGLERFFDVSPASWTQPLESQGFVIPEVAFSPYVNTEAAIPALLDMAYPIVEGPGITKATSRSLFARIGGENRAVRILKSNGYAITMLESGWSGSICGRQIDHVCRAPSLMRASSLR
jgi:hypothetical protein